MHSVLMLMSVILVFMTVILRLFVQTLMVPIAVNVSVALLVTAR
jgi:hypothetical protein